MKIDPITITFPTTRAEPTKDQPNRRVPVTMVVQWSGELIPFNDVKDGAMFLDGDEVFEKLGTNGDIGKLHPWGESYLMVVNKNVGVLKVLQQPRFK